MRYLLTLLAFPLLSAALLHAQSPTIQSALDAVSIDSLVQQLRQLSGELPVDVGNGEQFIVSRNNNNAGNQLASDWLQQRTASLLGGSVYTQNFGPTGQNVYAYKLGMVHPGRKVVICGHYDAMPGGPVAAPAADDDGSGTISVLEAMRVLAPYDFENTLCFGMWDQEEQGLLGSAYFAGVAAASDDTIIAVINMDAISYDSNGDRHMKVHTKNIANSFAIKDTALLVNSLYNIDLPITVQNPGATYSDHASFWSEGYGAILIIEDFENDGNPHYHTSTDLVQYIDQGFWSDLTKLSIATAATIAVPYASNTAVEPLGRNRTDILAYPNPTSGMARLRVNSAGPITRITIVDALGGQWAPMNEGTPAAGVHAFDIDLTGAAPGSYVIRVEGRDGTSTARLVKLP